MRRVGKARGICPDCRRNIPFSKAFWGLGKVFACKGCKRDLFIPKAQIGVALAGFVVLFYLATFLPPWLVIGIAIFFGLLDWAFLKVYRVELRERLKRQVEEPSQPSQ